MAKCKFGQQSLLLFLEHLKTYCYSSRAFINTIGLVLSFISHSNEYAVFFIITHPLRSCWTWRAAPEGCGWASISCREAFHVAWPPKCAGARPPPWRGRCWAGRAPDGPWWVWRWDFSACRTPESTNRATRSL